MSETSAGFPADRLGTWLENASRRRPPPMPASLLADLRNILAEHKLMAEHLIECPSMAAAERQQDGAVADVTAFLDVWEAEHGSGSIRGGNADVPYLFSSDLRAVLAERTVLAERVAELEAEREADVRAVAALLEYLAAFGNAPITTRQARKVSELFADRMDALAASDQAALDAKAPDAAQEGLSATETDGDDVQGSGDVTTPVRATAGLSERCGHTAGYHVCVIPAGPNERHSGDHRDGTGWGWATEAGTWPNADTTEDGQHG